MEITINEGGVTSPKGFLANGIHCGLRKNRTKRDLALIRAEKPCRAAAIYTQNKVYGAPITVTRENLKDGVAQAIICNSGNANTCNADGVEKARAMCAAVAAAVGVRESDVIVASTGVIGQPLPLEPILGGMAALAGGAAATLEKGTEAALAIMTTDTRKKECAVQVQIGGKTVTVGGMAKGSGMIEPNMATMLCFLTTDAEIDRPLLEKALRAAAELSFHKISVDGDTSTNDMLCILASGLAQNPPIDREGEEYSLFCAALNALCIRLARWMAADGEGATKLLECVVENARSERSAGKLAKAVIKSSLVKTAMFGADANWGRILCALGYAGEEIDVGKIGVSLCSAKGELPVCENGRGVPFSEERAKEILLQTEVTIRVNMNDGTGTATAWGCDLSYEYVRINGDYRS